MDNVVEIKKVSKKYLLGGSPSPTTIREVLGSLGSSLRSGASPSKEFWALNDVSFEVKAGQRLGLIGRNGAGKSTLLKLLSRVTQPTGGSIKMKGRVASLLEVGTGFHPELTGRENIFLNGTILGMSRAEIKAKFDEIVAFSEIEAFLDTPVKRYSSGMYVRLAFAIAAHLDPDILVVDEVLAVGDARFQKRSLGKMKEASRSGRTLIFVSHDMTAIQGLCDRCILLDRGALHADGAPPDVIREYLRETELLSKIPLSERADRSGDGSIRATAISFGTSADCAEGYWKHGEDAYLQISFESKSLSGDSNLEVSAGILEDGRPLIYLGTKLVDSDFSTTPTKGVFVCRIPRLCVRPGKYGIAFDLKKNGVITDMFIDPAAFIEVKEGDYFGTGRDWPYGSVSTDFNWTVQSE